MKKLLISFLTSLIILLSFAPYFPARAQSTWYNQNPFEWYVKVYDKDTSPPNEIFGERYTAAQVQWVMYSVMFAPLNFFYSLLGMDPSLSVCVANLMTGTVNVDACLSTMPDFFNALKDKIHLPRIIASNDSTGSPASVWKTILTENRPISAISYVRDIGKKLRLVPEAKAADTWGYGNLSPIQNIWKVTRNFAYFLFVIATIVISFAIMFKVKISPQVVISIQSALPKIIAALILVTFSYAIAGLMVDLIYVLMGIFTQFFGSPGSAITTFNFLKGFWDNFITIFVYSILYLVIYFFSIIFIVLFSALGFLNITSVIWGAFLFVFIIGVLIILLVNLFVGALTLFKTLAKFYVLVMVGPIQIATDVIPGMGGHGFSGWLKGIIATLLVFPVTGILWYFAFVFVTAAPIVTAQCAAVNWGGPAIQSLKDFLTYLQFPGFWELAVPRVTGHCWGPPLLGNAGGATGIAFLLISVGCIIAITKVPKQIESFMAGKGYLETGITEAMGPLGGVARSAGALGSEYAAGRAGAWQWKYGQRIPDRGIYKPIRAVSQAVYKGTQPKQGGTVIGGSPTQTIRGPEQVE